MFEFVCLCFLLFCCFCYFFCLSLALYHVCYLFCCCRCSSVSLLFYVFLFNSAPLSLFSPCALCSCSSSFSLIDAFRLSFIVQSAKSFAAVSLFHLSKRKVLNRCLSLSSFKTQSPLPLSLTFVVQNVKSFAAAVFRFFRFPFVVQSAKSFAAAFLLISFPLLISFDVVLPCILSM